MDCGLVNGGVVFCLLVEEEAVVSVERLYCGDNGLFDDGLEFVGVSVGVDGGEGGVGGEVPVPVGAFLASGEADVASDLGVWFFCDLVVSRFVVERDNNVGFGFQTQSVSSVITASTSHSSRTVLDCDVEG